MNVTIDMINTLLGVTGQCCQVEVCINTYAHLIKYAVCRTNTHHVHATINVTYMHVSSWNLIQPHFSYAKIPFTSSDEIEQFYEGIEIFFILAEQAGWFIGLNAFSTSPVPRCFIIFLWEMVMRTRKKILSISLFRDYSLNYEKLLVSSSEALVEFQLVRSHHFFQFCNRSEGGLFLFLLFNHKGGDVTN